MNALLTIHVALSLIEIAAGFAVVYGLLSSQRLDGWTLAFLATGVATNATGFMLPAHRFLPSHAIGILSLVAFGVAIYARSSQHFAGRWRWIYAVSIVVALYIDVFAAVFQSFLKIPALHELAPTQSEPPFAIAQGVVTLAFIALGIAAAKKFHPAGAAAPAPLSAS
jgi:hypothetical protein